MPNYHGKEEHKQTLLPFPLAIPKQVSSPFGHSDDNFHKNGHRGCDYYTNKEKLPLYAPIEGTLTPIDDKVYKKSVYGAHAVQLTGTEYTFIFGHLSENILHGASAHVVVGDLLGMTGGGKDDPSPGQSTGRHLHVTAIKNGVVVDPDPLFSAEGFNAPINNDDFPDGPSDDDGDDDGGLGKKIAVTLGIITGVGLVVGLLTETIQGACFRASRTSPILQGAFYKLSTIPGLRHIDWHKADVSPGIDRKHMFRKFKELCYSGDKVYVGHRVGDAFEPLDCRRVVDVDFGDTLEIEVEGFPTLYAVEVQNHIRPDDFFATNIAYVLTGYCEDGVRRWVAMQGAVNGLL